LVLETAMIRLNLPDADVRRLERVFRETADRRLRDRVQIVLMAHRGRAHAQIAADLAISRRTVPRWLNAYLDRGLDGLIPKRAKGAPAKVPAELADEVTRWVAEGPAKQGLDRANWTYAELADHLLKAKGIRASRSAVGRFCRKLGVRVYRPTYRYLRGDPAKQAAARDDLAELKKSRRGGTRAPEPGRGPLPDGADAHRHPGHQGATAGGRDLG
jgi:transposase